MNRNKLKQIVKYLEKSELSSNVCYLIVITLFIIKRVLYYNDPTSNFIFETVITISSPILTLIIVDNALQFLPHQNNKTISTLSHFIQLKTFAYVCKNVTHNNRATIIKPFLVFVITHGLVAASFEYMIMQILETFTNLTVDEAVLFKRIILPLNHFILMSIEFGMLKRLVKK